MFDSDFKAGKLRCHTWSFFLVSRVNWFVTSLCFCILASQIKLQLSLFFFLSLATFKVCSMYN